MSLALKNDPDPDPEARLELAIMKVFEGFLVILGRLVGTIGAGGGQRHCQTDSQHKYNAVQSGQPCEFLEYAHDHVAVALISQLQSLLEANGIKS